MKEIKFTFTEAAWLKMSGEQRRAALDMVSKAMGKIHEQAKSPPPMRTEIRKA